MNQNLNHMPNYNSKSKKFQSPSEKDLQKLQHELEETNTTLFSSIQDNNAQLQATRDLINKLNL